MSGGEVRVLRNKSQEPNNKNQIKPKIKARGLLLELFIFCILKLF
jgi:hypothetical protein